MKINNIAPVVSKAVGAGFVKLGQAAQKSGSVVDKLNKFAEGRGMNPGRGAFLLLISTCTLVPRFLKARDNDERSEILRRDVTTILTITFAMKAIKAGLSKLMAKKKGLPLTFTNIPEDANPLKKALGYFQQKGTTAFSAEDITANYANIDGKDTILRMLDFVDGNKGDVGKVLTFDKAKPASLFGKQKPDGALTKAAKQLLGNDFDFSQSGKEIIRAIQAKDASNPAFNAISNVLKDTDTNPISKFGKGIGGKFETAAFATVVLFLGFGLPKLNERLTKNKYLSKDGTSVKPPYENPNSPVPKRDAISTLNMNQRMIFQNFLGAYENAMRQPVSMQSPLVQDVFKQTVKR